MGQILNAQGQAVDKDGNAKVLPGLDMRDPVTSLDLLSAVGRGLYTMAAQYGMLAGPKGERHVKLQARDVAAIAGQGATVTDFASNVLSELAFTLAEAEARIAVLKGLLPDDKVKEADEADMAVAVEWENRRSQFSMKVPIALKKKERLGLCLADTIKGEAPTPETFTKLAEEAKAAGLQVQTPEEAAAEAAARAADGETVAAAEAEAAEAAAPADAPKDDAPLASALETAKALGTEE